MMQRSAIAGGRPRTYRFDVLDVGDALTVAVNRLDPQHVKRSIDAAARQFARTHAPAFRWRARIEGRAWVHVERLSDRAIRSADPFPHSQQGDHHG